MAATTAEQPVALVVDDDPDVALVCSLQLEGAGYSVLEAPNGRRGLELARSALPSVIVLDYMLPDFDGIEVLRRLKGDEATASIPVVMLTARTSERDQVAAWDAGAADYITKPFDWQRLIESVNAASKGDLAEAQARHRSLVERIRNIDAGNHAILASLIESTQDAVILKSLDGTITFWNSGAHQLYGWSAEEAVGSPVTLLAVPGAEDEIPNLLMRVAGGERIDSFETVRLHRNGRRIHVSLTDSPVFDANGTVVAVSSIARDVSERVRMEDRFRRVVEGAPDAMVIVDADGRIELANQQTERLFGHPRADLIGQPIEMLAPVRLRSELPDYRRAYRNRMQTWELGPGVELSGLRSDGTEFPVEISLSPLNAESDASYAATIRDVTQRRTAESQFRALVEAAPDAIVGVDDNGRIVLANNQTEHLFGCRREELVGQQIELLVPGFGAGQSTEGDSSVREPRAGSAGSRGLDLVARRKDGSQFPAEISLSFIDIEGGRLVTAAIRDVTARAQAEARFRGLVEAAPDAMVIVGEDGRIQLVNQQTERLFGYERAELIDKQVEILVPNRFRDKHPQNRRTYGQHPRLRPMGAGLELAGLRKDGTEFPVEISLSPLATEQGVTISASIRDVSERRKTEEAQALAIEREREATARLREVDRMRSDFLSTVSHELRTPLTAIKGFAEWLVNSWDTTPDERKRDIVTRMLHAGGRLDLLIQDLLDFSRLERGQLKVSVAAHELSTIIDETIRHNAPALQEHHLDVRIAEQARVVVDRSAMIRVVENLLTNAAKFSPPGSRIEVTSTTEPGWVVLSVRDEGVGIPESEQAKVFDRFYRVADSAAKHPGTGIGLAIVKQFVEAQGGHVMLHSAENEGTEFTLRLRAAPAPMA